jgi:hypothetical protein
MKRALFGVALFFGLSIGSASHAQTLQNGSIPSGTPIHVRTIDSVDVNSAYVGAKYRGTLADPVMANGRVVIPRGAPVVLSAVRVEKPGAVKGRPRLSVKVDSITYGGRTYAVASSVFDAAGKMVGKRTLKGMGIGAGAGGLIGGLAGGGTGLAVGALLGGGAGTAVSAGTANRSLVIPSESVLTFQLNSPLPVK